MANLRFRAATTLVGNATGYFFDGLTNLVAGAQQVRAFATQLDTSTNTTSAGFFCVTVAAYRGRGVHLDMRQNVMSTGAIRIETTVANTLSGIYRGIVCDLSTNVTPGANEVTGLAISIPATTRASTALEGAIVVDSQATAARVIDVAVANTAGTLAQVRYRAATVLAGTTTGFQINLTTNVTAGANAIIGLQVNVAASTVESNAILINTLATTPTASMIAGTINNTQGGAIQVTFGNPTTLTGAIVAQDWDLSTNVTPGANSIIGLRITVAATTRASTAGEAAVVIDSRATLAKCLEIQTRNTQGTIAHIRYPVSTTTNGTLTGLDIDLQGNVSGSGNGVVGVIVRTVSNTQVGTNGVACFATFSNLTAARITDFGVRNVSGTLHLLSRYSTSVTLTGALTAVSIDLNTNVVPGANAISAIVINIGATTRANTALEGALVIDSQATAARVVDLALANTSGTPVIVRYRAATTPNAVVMATLDLSTNVTSNANANVGLDIPIVAADEDTTAPLRLNAMRVFVGTGAPNNANGTDGDEYHRKDGGALSSIYKKVAGAWLAIA